MGNGIPLPLRGAPFDLRTCLGAPAGIQRFKYAPSSVTASPCHLPPSGGKACGRVWVPYGQIGTFRGGRVRAPAPTKYGELSGLSVEAGHWPARRWPLAAHLIRPLRGHLPLKGKAFGRLIAAPTVHRKPVGAHSMRPPEFAPVPLVRKRQARERNRTSPNFPPTQAPSGAGRDHTQALLILRAGNILPTSRDNPRNGVRGKRSYGPRRSKAEP